MFESIAVSFEKFEVRDKPQMEKAVLRNRN